MNEHERAQYERLDLEEQAEKVDCPRCGVKAGRHCVNIRDRSRVMTAPHWQRIPKPAKGVQE